MILQSVYTLLLYKILIISSRLVKNSEIAEEAENPGHDQLVFQLVKIQLVTVSVSDVSVSIDVS